MSSAGTMATAAELPVLRIAPPQGLWDLNLGELWQFRELVYFFVWRDIKIRYKQTAIGAAWAVLQPFLAMVVFTLFFGILAHIPSGGLPYPIFYYSALLPWLYFAASLQAATNTIVENQRMITKVYFPRLALPVSAVLSGLVDFGAGFLLFLVMMVFYGIRPGIPLLLFPVFLLLAVLAALGVGLWLSAMNAIYRDVRYVVPFLVQFWLFASPVAYASSLVQAKWPAFYWVYGLNPMAGVIEGFRWSLSGQGTLPGRLILLSTGIALFLVISGLIYFQKMESTVADVV
ncbi:MAG TPA: ABC transporter permease [Candidatus Acidoferrales bacterium]|nr:ABC transporter permease [Candidatus Acidoferrales bacterium]